MFIKKYAPDLIKSDALAQNTFETAHKYNQIIECDHLRRKFIFQITPAGRGQLECSRVVTENIV